MRLEELDLQIPEELIAQRPCEPRDACRLLHLERGGGISHRVFSELPALLRPGDVLVLNDSRVLAARVHMVKPTGGRVELLFLRSCDEGGSRRWEVLARPSARLRPGTVLTAGREKGAGFPRAPESLEPLRVELEMPLGEGRWRVVVQGEKPVANLLAEHGQAPLPPYIKEPLNRPEEYQTVYCREPGSAAAPTAGLHFTSDLLGRAGRRGIEIVRVTLHVGLDTFRPIQAESVEEHEIHQEWYTVRPEELARLNAARSEGRRLIAVGTTAVRVLETLYAGSAPGGPARGPVQGWTGLYITPGHEFRAVDALITNFHLPRTSLLALVMAFAGVHRIREAYGQAVACGYRFFSFGDAMLIE